MLERNQEILVNKDGVWATNLKLIEWAMFGALIIIVDILNYYNLQLTILLLF